MICVCSYDFLTVMKAGCDDYGFPQTTDYLSISPLHWQPTPIIDWGNIQDLVKTEKTLKNDMNTDKERKKCVSKYETNKL